MMSLYCIYLLPTGVLDIQLIHTHTLTRLSNEIFTWLKPAPVWMLASLCESKKNPLLKMLGVCWVGWGLLGGQQLIYST